MSEQHGKVISDAMGEVQRGLENIEFATGDPEPAEGRVLRAGVDRRSTSTRSASRSASSPGITPFNFPAMVPMWMFANAIACGNTFILKPSEKDPGASMFVAELLKDAGVPDGVFNIVHGDKVAVDAILHHPDIAAVSFVGSTPIARYIYETGTANGKRVQALGGAKNHMVVLPDADLDMAADAAVSAGYGSAGERCMAISMVVAVGGIGDELVAKIAERLPNVKVGAGDEDGRRDGPARHARAPRQGGVLPRQRARAGRDARPRRPRGRRSTDRDGFFLGVSLLDHVTPEMDAYRDEIFGPVLGVTRVETYDDAVRMVNENPYGNGVAIFTRDGGAARRFQFEVEAGMVGVNVPIPVPGRLLLVRRVEGVVVRRQPHVRARGRAVLHAGQGRHAALARPVDVDGRPGLPAHALTGRRSQVDAEHQELLDREDRAWLAFVDACRSSPTPGVRTRASSPGGR